MKRPVTRLELMQAAALIQNPIVRPRKLSPENVNPPNQAITSAFTQAQVPGSTRDIPGSGDAVKVADRAGSEGADA